MKKRQHKIFFTIALITILIIGGALLYYFSLPYIIVYILSINILSMTFYLYDKAISQTGKGRVPETVLHTIALLGGSLGALLAAIILRHKTSKQSFMLITWTILSLQSFTIGFLTYKGIIF